MPPAPRPSNEDDRLAALRKLKILDTEPTQEFDIFAKLASDLLETPVAAVSLVDADRQWFKASIGLDVSETPRDVSFCAHVLHRPDETLYVPDTAADPRFADNPLVKGEFGLRFYAGAPVRSPDGHILGALCVIDRKPRTLTQAELETLEVLAAGVGGAIKLHASTQALAERETTDEVTGLLNRPGYERALAAALERQRSPPGNKTAVLMLDLDGFRSVNQLFGHSGGNEALREVARRVGRATRSRDTVCRIGADQFCIVAEDMRSPLDVEQLAERIHASLAEPFVLDGQEVALQACIGVAVGPDHGDNVEELTRIADRALGEAKRAGRALTRVAGAGEVGPRPGGRTEIRDMLRRALLPPGKEPFALALQPIMRAADKRLLGFEALARWPLPDGSVLPPGHFIPAAEATGLVVHLDRFVLDRACALAATWPQRLFVSSNLSAANFIAGDLVGEVRQALQRHSLAPGRLKLEVTETVMLHEPERVQRIIRELRTMGVEVSLDDFGAGHASLSYLRDYAFSGLKIDRSFTAAIETDGRSRTFVQTIVNMASALGIGVVAEGVETEAQLQQLAERGVEAVQGYLLGRPMRAEEAEAVIAADEQAVSEQAEIPLDCE